MASTALAVVHDLDEYRRRRLEQAELAARKPQTAVAPMMWCFVWMPVPYAYAMGLPAGSSSC